LAEQPLPPLPHHLHPSILFECANKRLKRFAAYSLNVVNIGLEPRLHPDLDPRASVLEPFEDLLVPDGVSLDQGIFEILKQGVLIAHLDIPFHKHVRIEEVFRALDVIL
jgi:hypothetical protein